MGGGGGMRGGGGGETSIINIITYFSILKKMSRIFYGHL